MLFAWRRVNKGHVVLGKGVEPDVNLSHYIHLNLAYIVIFKRANEVYEHY